MNIIRKLILDGNRYGTPITSWAAPLAIIKLLLCRSGWLATLFYRIRNCFVKLGPLGQIAEKLTGLIARILVPCEIHAKATIAPGLHLPHAVGVIIGEGVLIEENTTIYQGVTIGHNEPNIPESDHGARRYPRIGHDVTIYPGAIVVGDISIGHNVIIAANSVVTKDVPANQTVAGIPAKPMRNRKAPLVKPMSSAL